MLVFSRVNVETSGVSFVCNTISDSTSEDQTTALHVVVHHVFENWGIFFVIDKIEIDFLVSCDVDSNVTFDEI